MTKLFQLIIGLLRRHLALFAIYRRYLKRRKQFGSAEHLFKSEDLISEEDGILFKTSNRKRRYHSLGDINIGYSCRSDTGDFELNMPCATPENRARYHVRNTAERRRGHAVSSAFMSNSVLDLDSNGNDIIVDFDHNWANDNLVIAHKDDFSIGDILGSGGFGSVFIGRYCGRRVAVKSVRQSSKNREAGRQSFQAEFNALLLRHNNIVSVLATTAYEDFDAGAFIIMEYAGRRNLQQVINDLTRSIPPTRRLKYARDIINALSYTHSQGIVHLDVKPANIIVDSSNVCRLADFGCSQRVESGVSSSSSKRSHLTGTFAYRAPELLRGCVPSTKADVYSYAVTLWQLWTRQSPFAGENHHVVIFGVVAHNLRPTLPLEKNTNDAWYERLVTRCWEGCVAKRPCADEVLIELECRASLRDFINT